MLEDPGNVHLGIVLVCTGVGKRIRNALVGSDCLQCRYCCKLPKGFCWDCDQGPSWAGQLSKLFSMGTVSRLLL